MLIRLPASFCHKDHPEAVLIQWHVSVGQEVRRWQKLADVVNDKCAYELCAKVGRGRVTEILVAAGTEVRSGQALLEIEVLEE